jgi:hypothetical protein
MTIIRVTAGELGIPGLPHADSIIFYVDAADSNSYAGTGTTVTDISGFATNGTLDGGAVVAGGAFQIDGTGSKGVSFTKSSTLTDVFLGGATLMTFVQTDAPGDGGSGRFVATESAAQTEGWLLYGVTAFSATGVQPRFIRRSGGGTDGSWNSSGALPRGSAVTTGGGFSYGSVAVTYDETVLSNDPTFYTNGLFTGTPTGTNPSALGSDASEDLVIGNINGGSEAMDGQSQVTLIWDRILTAEEILQVHNTVITRMGRRGSVPGVVTMQPNGGLGGSSHLIRAAGLGQPSVADGNSGCINFQAQTASGKGITGTNTDYAALLSGRDGTIGSNCDGSVRAGGTNNTVSSSCGAGVIGGGASNTIGGGDENCIVGGTSNTVVPSYAGMVCGFQNVIYGNGTYAFMGGGRSNVIGKSGHISTAEYTVVGGGRDNNIELALYSSILGGQQNGIGITTDSSYSWVEGGYQNVVEGADFGNAAGRQSKCNHNGATIWSDSTVQDEETDRDNQHKRVYVGGFTERTTTGFGGAVGSPGEALERFTGHDATADATLSANTLFDLTTDQHTVMIKVYVHSQRDTGDNFLFTEITVFGRRTGGTTSVSSATVATANTGTGSTVVHAVATSVSQIDLNITGNSGENWQHSFWYERQEGGLTS